jgi:hypothetical protein
LLGKAAMQIEACACFRLLITQNANSVTQPMPGDKFVSYKDLALNQKPSKESVFSF